jgi:hypothetical protein
LQGANKIKNWVFKKFSKIFNSKWGHNIGKFFQKCKSDEKKVSKKLQQGYFQTRQPNTHFNLKPLSIGLLQASATHAAILNVLANIYVLPKKNAFTRKHKKYFFFRGNY